jgi:hypothetical protein
MTLYVGGFSPMGYCFKAADGVCCGWCTADQTDDTKYITAAQVTTAPRLYFEDYDYSSTVFERFQTHGHCDTCDT